MMGLPDGWATGVAGVTRTNQLKILGNGVVPQQAHLALHLLNGGDMPTVGTAELPRFAPTGDELLPTPTPFTNSNKETPDEWLRRRADVIERTGTHHGLPLAVAAASISEGRPIRQSDPMNRNQPCPPPASPAATTTRI